jgi:GTPase SAR1 family protein
LIQVADQDYVIESLELHSTQLQAEHPIKLAHGFVLVYSVTSRESFTGIQSLYDHIRKVTNNDKFPVLLVGRKSDLVAEREVQMAEGEQLAARLRPRCRFMETSAKTGENVDEIFNDIASAVHRKESIRKEDLASQSTQPGMDKDGKETRKLGTFDRIKQAFRQRKNV